MILRKAAFASTVRMDMSFFDKPENQTASILVSLERHGLYRGYIGNIGHIYIYTGYIYIHILGLCRKNGKENGNYYNGFERDWCPWRGT